MGYITDFTLEAKTLRRNTPVLPEVIEDINRALKEYDDDHYLSGLEWSDILQEWRMCDKWYSHTEDMQEFSKKFPDVVFWLEGDGEDTNDRWREYHWNGNVQAVEAEITFGECPW